jgi:hypothetical protein
MVFLDARNIYFVSLENKKHKRATLPIAAETYHSKICWDGGRWVVVLPGRTNKVMLWDLKYAVEIGEEKEDRNSVWEHTVSNQAEKVAMKGKVVAVGCRSGKIDVFHVKKVFAGKGKGGKVFLAHYSKGENPPNSVGNICMDEKEVFSVAAASVIKAFSLDGLMSTYKGNITRRKKSDAER